MIASRRIVILALFVAMASILHIVEGWLPVVLPVPGAKLGLANIISLFLVVTLGLKSALYVAVARVTLGSLFGASFLGPAFIMSMGGAISSILVMHFGLRHLHPPFSLCGVSILGATAHNVAQVVLAAFLVSSASLLWYIPYLIFFAVPTGLFIGALVKYLVGRIPAGLIY